MSEGITLTIGEDGVAREYDDTYDLTIHCKNEIEYEALMGIFKTGFKIIRCKDCKFWQSNNNDYPMIECKWREDETPDEDDFCSCGERKDE